MEDVAYRVLAAQQTPDHSTIARFRVRHEESLAALFSDVLLLCKEAGGVERWGDRDLAVGMNEGAPFALSNRCRHLFASLGKGHVMDDGCFECPWHRALYDVGTG